MTDALRVRAAMETGFPRLTPATPIRRAVAELIAARIHAAAVVAPDGTLCGLLTQKDCFRPALHASYYREWRGMVADHMSRDVVFIDAEEGIVQAAEMFLDLPHRVLPVLTGGKPVGMLERSAVMAALFASG